jgi:ribosomal protein S18 acetylase RimI-like enzyme
MTTMETAKYQIAPIAESQIQPAGEVLTQAFFPDPLCIYTFPDLEKRARAFTWFFTASVQESALLHGVYTTIGQVNGAAVWFPPDTGEPKPEQKKLTELDQMNMHFGAEACHRFTSVFSYLSRSHQQTVPGPHWYLALLGVSPPYQSKGIGGLLLTPMLQQADRDGIPCYLETFNPRTVPFYQRHGFQIAIADVEPQSQIPFWTMRKDPLTSH